MNESLIYEKYEHYVNDIIDDVFDKHGSEFVQAKGIDRSKSQLKSIKQKIKQAMKLEHIEPHLREAFQLISKNLYQVASTSELSQAFHEFSNSRSSMESYYEAFIKEEESQANPTLQEILGYSNDTLACCYRLGLRLFNEGSYSDAYTIFSLLYLLSPYVPAYFTAAAICEKSQQNFHVALEILSRAKQILPNDPSLYIHSAHCYLELQQLKEAKQELTEAENRLTEEEDILIWQKTLDDLKLQLAKEV